MNSSLLRAAVLGTGLFFVPGSVPAILAGPGPQYWQDQTDAAAAVTKTDPVASVFCPGSVVVPIMAAKPAWPNGKGPTTFVQVGTKHVCTVCPVTGVAVSGWANGRGPAVQTETDTQGIPHDCGAGCVVAPKN